MTTSYIESYVMGLPGVSNRRDFSGTNNSAASGTNTYGNINESKTNRDTKKTEENNKQAIKDIRLLAIRNLENSVTPGQIWVKMDETDARMGKNLFPNKTIVARNITANIDGNADGAELATLLTTNNNGNLQDGSIKRYHIVDSVIHPDTYTVVTPGKTFVLNDTNDIPGISIDYGDYYKSGTTVWLAVRSNEKQHEHNRKHTLEVKEVRNEAIRIRENSVTPGQIWVKMDETDPRMGKNLFPNKTIAARNITANIDGNADGAELVTLLTTNENTNLKTGDKKRYHIVDSEIDRVTYETITYGKTFILLDTSDIPTLNPVIEYGDYYKDGTNVWMITNSYEVGRENARQIEIALEIKRNNDRTTETTGNGRSEAFQAWDPDGTLGRNWSLVSSFPANFTEANKVELTNSPLGNIRAVLEGGTTAFTITQLINTYGFGTANKIAIGEYIIHSSGSGSGYWIPLPVVNPSYASLLVVGGESRNDLLANFANGSSI